MTAHEPTKLAEPFEHVEVEIEADEVEVFDWRVGSSVVRKLEYAEAEAKAVLAAIRKHKANMNLDDKRRYAFLRRQVEKGKSA